jgi:thiamine-monophosphate kinase
MMDLSDGLAADLPRLAAASGCGFRLNRAALPCARGVTAEEAIRDGEDYELLFAVSPRTSLRLERGWAAQFPKVKLSAIGSLCEGEGESLHGGWDHFGK